MRSSICMRFRRPRSRARSGLRGGGLRSSSSWASGGAGAPSPRGPVRAAEGAVVSQEPHASHTPALRASLARAPRGEPVENFPDDVEVLEEIESADHLILCSKAGSLRQDASSG